jgi:hypothetical protein
MDVSEFLRELELQQYEATFRDNRIDIRVTAKADRRGPQGPWRYDGRRPTRAA